jgi:hypothetical protein
MHQGIKMIDILSTCTSLLDMENSSYQLIVLVPLKVSIDSRAKNSCQWVSLRLNCLYSSFTYMVTQKKIYVVD